MDEKIDEDEDQTKQIIKLINNKKGYGIGYGSMIACNLGTWGDWLVK